MLECIEPIMIFNILSRGKNIPAGPPPQPGEQPLPRSCIVQHKIAGCLSLAVFIG